jgi:hypothetical protein
LVIVEFWLTIMRDETARVADRLEASRLLADRGWGKAALREPLEDAGHQVSQDQWDMAVSAFDAEVARLSARQTTSASGKE